MFSKSLSSIGKHRSASSRVHDNMLLAQMKDIYFLFFFKNGEYREIPLDDVAWPEKMSYDSRASIKKDEIVLLYFEGDFCPGRFIAKGDLETLKMVCEKMDPRIECANTTEDRANLSFNAEIIAASQALSQPQTLVKRSYVALRSLKEGTARNAKKMRNDDEIHVLAQKSYKTLLNQWYNQSFLSLELQIPFQTMRRKMKPMVFITITIVQVRKMKKTWKSRSS